MGDAGGVGPAEGGSGMSAGSGGLFGRVGVDIPDWESGRAGRPSTPSSQGDGGDVPASVHTPSIATRESGEPEEGGEVIVYRSGSAMLDALIEPSSVNGAS